MDKIKSLEIGAFVSNAVNEVFNTMLSLEAELFDADSGVAMGGERIVGSVDFAGDVMGSVNIHVTDGFARLMTAAMLDMELEEVKDQGEVDDVIGELSNMIGGDIKSRLCDIGLPCDLSIPSVTTGSDFKIESRGWARHEFLGIRHQQHIAMVEVYIKSAVKPKLGG